MFVKANYQEDDEPCIVNTDFVIDIFKTKDGKWLAYTFDNERRGYYISKEVVEELLKGVTDGKA